MDKWEYCNVTIGFQEFKDDKGKKYKNWGVRYSNGDLIEGIDQVLNAYGQHGWELVNLVLAHAYQATQFGGTDPDIYFAIFKRRVKEQNL